MSAAHAHLTQWAQGRVGVEAWIEPPTTVSGASVLLIDLDGDSTRRTVASVADGHALAARLKIPSHDAGLVSYPYRFRQFNARRRHELRRRD